MMQRYTVYLYLKTALRVSGGTSTHHQEHIQLSTASGICHTVTAICRYRGSVGTGLNVLWLAYFHPSSGAHATVSTASGICHTVTAFCRYRGRVGTRLNVLWLA
jgi:hypothetical protein